MASNWPPLPKQPIGTALGPRGAPIQMEVFLDYCCPFSKKAFFVLTDQVIPAMEGKICFYFQHQIQPWHPQSTLLHEAALAVKQVDPDKFFPYSRILFENLDNFVDQKVYQKSRKELYEQLAKLAKEVGIDSEQVLKKMEILDTKEGNDITADLKLSIRYARQLDIHVSPTFIINRMKDPAASSSWSVAEWKQSLFQQKKPVGSYSWFQAVERRGEGVVEPLEKFCVYANICSMSGKIAERVSKVCSRGFIDRKSPPAYLRLLHTVLVRLVKS